MKVDEYHEKQLFESVEYRLNRSLEALLDAQTLVESESWNSSVSRLYFACFYAVSAYLLVMGETPKSRDETTLAFTTAMVKSGIVSETLGIFFRTILDSRLESDYGDFVQFDSETVLPMLAQARDFVAVVTEITNRALNNLPLPKDL
jgi:uncharacterized protein (UPF0332 family)